ncbi:MAG: hypothetical protein GOP50_08920 [Candidatus Heimdallarchaeota archaeon]|nr:hypothetical protein [Candidatus Heimdallarchaeota archaeon]
MNAEKKKINEDPPQPGKTIVFLEGEILSVKLNQWGFVGKLKTKYGDYSYKLKDSISTSNDIMVGLKLVITNGYCYENKRKEIVVSDGKFGKINTEIETNFIMRLNHENKLLIGKLTSITQKDNSYKVLLEIPFPPFSEYEITIDIQKLNQLTNINEKLGFFANKLIIIEGEGNLDDLLISRLELLNENHYILKLIELNQGRLQNISNFSKIILNQINYIENFHAAFKDILFNMRGKVSKNLLDDLKELLLSKILDGGVKYPYNILISKQDIEHYFDIMVKFSRDIIYGNSNITSPEELVTYLRYYYPSFEIEKS